jgi:hypothetical protein
MLTYISSLFVGIEIWKLRVIFIYMQGIRCPSLSIFGFAIREKKKFSWEDLRLLAHPWFISMLRKQKNCYNFITLRATTCKETIRIWSKLILKKVKKWCIFPVKKYCINSFFHIMMFVESWKAQGLTEKKGNISFGKSHYYVNAWKNKVILFYIKSTKKWTFFF